MKHTHKMNAVFFDFGDTLVSLNPQKEDLFIKAALKIGMTLDKAAVKRAYGCVDFFMKFSSVLINKDSEKTEFYRLYNERLCEALGMSTSFTELWPFISEMFNGNKKWQLAEGSMETLTGLWSSGVRLAIVANWDRSLGELVRSFDIGHLFECVVSSQEAGVEKPNPAIFQVALRAMSLIDNPGSVVYVGNEYRADIVGARSAGLVPCLLDIDNRYPYADCRRIALLRELFSVIDHIHV